MEEEQTLFYSCVSNQHPADTKTGTKYYEKSLGPHEQKYKNSSKMFVNQIQQYIE